MEEQILGRTAGSKPQQSESHLHLDGKIGRKNIYYTRGEKNPLVARDDQKDASWQGGKRVAILTPI